MARKYWNVGKMNKDLASRIADQYRIAPFSALLLCGRGIDTAEKLDRFFSPREELEDPFALPDMQVAIDRINEAIFGGEHICVFGDYDCDGVTATAILYSYLEAQGAEVSYLLPNRLTEGYGLSMQAIETMHERGTQLIITVDNGIAAVEEARRAKEFGMDLIITDHHLEGEERPEALAIVDAHRKDANCPFDDYCGAGVALQICCALEGNSSRVLEDLGDLAAIGTVADMVPLRGDNRKIVQFGLRLINEQPRPGIQALLAQAYRGERSISSTEIAFGIAPRINASGRMETPEYALELLMSEDPEQAAELAERIESLNMDRHTEEDRIFKAASLWLSQHPREAHMPVLVVAGEGWHEGVLGIVASKILEKYLRPVIVLSIQGEKAKGSARSIPGFSIYDAISSSAEFLSGFGGHELAAGLSLPSENIDKFRESINDYALGQPRVYPKTSIDIRLRPEGINMGLLSEIEILEPFGMSNESPVFGLFNMEIDNVESMGEENNHRRLVLHRAGGNTRVTAVCFRVPDFPWRRGDKVDTIVTLHRNFYNGRESISIFIEDIRPAGTHDDAMSQSEILYDRLLSGQSLTPEEAEEARPDRSQFAAVYQYLKRNGPLSSRSYEYLNYRTGNGPLIKTMVILEAMRELGLLVIRKDGFLELPRMENKVDLNEAPILQELDKYRKERR